MSSTRSNVSPRQDTYALFRSTVRPGAMLGPWTKMHPQCEMTTRSEPW